MFFLGEGICDKDKMSAQEVNGSIPNKIIIGLIKSNSGRNTL